VVLRQIQIFQGLQISVKFIRCDNAGEHQQELQNVCAKYGIQLEYTAPNTPQQNGLAERQFATDLSRANAMMEAADLTISMRNMLRGEAIMTASLMDNLCCKDGKQTPYENFYNKPSLLNPSHFIQFGRIGYVTDRVKINGKNKPKALKCLFTGYADMHSPHTYRFYNPITRNIILSRDVRWDVWNTVNPRLSMSSHRVQI
jgi:transposase InsO family protein